MRLFILALTIAVSGCSTILPIVETATQVVVSHYCTDTPPIGRSLLRARFNQIVSPNSIIINCSTDAGEDL
jgi:hypothetical protein